MNTKESADECSSADFYKLKKQENSGPGTIHHLQHHIGLLSNRVIVGHDDNGATVIVGQRPQDLHNVAGIGGVQIACGFVGQDDLTALGCSIRSKVKDSMTLLKAGSVAYRRTNVCCLRKNPGAFCSRAGVSRVIRCPEQSVLRLHSLPKHQRSPRHTQRPVPAAHPGRCTTW